ncbi:MAG TPA: hypothetical protein VEC11_17505 [Allosphingosinicella sp.]|nr:hypothetical protein [Allosphingosinicella sp.]
MFRAAPLHRRLLCLFMAFAMLVPAAAWGAHSLRHGLDAAATAPHHRQATAADKSDRTPVGDRQDGGHDHQLSLSVPVAALFGETPLVHPPLAAPAPPEMRVKTLALRAAEPPPAHPPQAS